MWEGSGREDAGTWREKDVSQGGGGRHEELAVNSPGDNIQEHLHLGAPEHGREAGGQHHLRDGGGDERC